MNFPTDWRVNLPFLFGPGARCRATITQSPRANRHNVYAVKNLSTFNPQRTRGSVHGHVNPEQNYRLIGKVPVDVLQSEAVGIFTTPLPNGARVSSELNALTDSLVFYKNGAS